jgi:hypothetical protein
MSSNDKNSHNSTFNTSGEKTPDFCFSAIKLYSPWIGAILKFQYWDFGYTLIVNRYQKKKKYIADTFRIAS